jgi:hypothetical protein
MLITALCSALLSCVVPCSGIFATHLHLLLPLLRNTPRLLPYNSMLITTLCSALLSCVVPCSGIFATHLHLLLPLLRDTPRLLPYKMAVRQREQQPQDRLGVASIEPTMRLEPGECTESLALDVARAQGVSGSILEQAMQDFKELQGVVGDAGISAVARALIRAAGSSERFRNAARGSSRVASSSGSGSAGAAAPQPGSESELPQQQQQQQDASDAAGAGDAIGSLRWARRGSRTRASAARQPPADAAAAEAKAKAEAELQQRVRTLLAQLVLGLPLNAKAPQPQPQPWPEGQGPAAVAGVGGVPLCGVVHHLAPDQQPPASHEIGSWVYVLRQPGDEFYVGESQVSRAQNS